MDWFTGPTLAIGITVVVGIGALIALGVRYLEARSRNDEDAARLQLVLAEPLAREPALTGCSVLPVVSVSLSGQAVVEMTGWVPSLEVRDAAVRAVEREAARIGQPVHIVDRLDIVGRDRAARAG